MGDETMRAVRFGRYGGIDELTVSEVPRPAAAAGRVVVRVVAASINPGEASIRAGRLHERWPARFPEGEGSDFAGVVTDAGAGVTSVAVGAEVIGWTDERASHAEFVSVPAGQLIAKPAGVPWAVAGALYVAGVTAWVAVRAIGAGPGDTVAISAAAGGVGSIAAQLARRAGASVIGIAGPASTGWLASRGVTPVSYGDGLAGRLRAAAPQGISAFIDCFGGGYVDLALELGVPAGRIDTIIDWDTAGRTGAKAEGLAAAANPAAALAELAALVAAGELEVPIAGTYPLEQVRDAYAELEQRHTRGKIVLLPAHDLSDAEIRALLERSMTIAVVGASTNPAKESSVITGMLIDAGFDVIPVHPTATEIRGRKAYPALADVPRPIDIADVFRPSEQTPDIARQAVAAGARALWLQSGIASAQARRIAAEGGLEYVEDRCVGATARRMGIRKDPRAPA